MMTLGSRWKGSDEGEISLNTSSAPSQDGITGTGFTFQLKQLKKKRPKVLRKKDKMTEGVFKTWTSGDKGQ